MQHMECTPIQVEVVLDVLGLFEANINPYETEWILAKHRS